MIHILGKLQALSGVTKDQRREYKSKFVDMDIEFQRMKERLETIHLILDDMQVCINNYILFLRFLISTSISISLKIHCIHTYNKNSFLQKNTREGLMLWW